MKKASRETQTLRAGCSKAEPKIFAPPQTPFPAARDGQINQLETVTTFIHKPSLVRIDARNFELSWLRTHRQTNTATNPQTGPITIHCAAASAQCNNMMLVSRHALPCYAVTCEVVYWCRESTLLEVFPLGHGSLPQL